MDSDEYRTFDATADFVSFVSEKAVTLYAHNGGKFDFIYLLPYVIRCSPDGIVKAQIINGRIISMKLGRCELRDSYAIIPVALRELAGTKESGVAKKEIEIWKLEKVHRTKHRAEILDYLFHDCQTLYKAVETYRSVAGKYKTIASNALAFSKKLKIDPGTTNYGFDASFRKYYFGGRTECFQPGTHHNLAVLDIHSAYPFAMQHDHANGHDRLSRSNLDGMTREEIQRSFITLECFASGCFPLRNGAQGLCLPHEFNEFNVTGWEYVAAKELGLIQDEKISTVKTFSGTINFRAYVEHWYKYKEAHPKKIDPMNYTIGKIMMNSLYGKLAQNPARYFDYKIVKAGTPACQCRYDRESNRLIPNVECPIKNNDDHGWLPGPENDDYEIHQRPTLYKSAYENGGDWVKKNIFKNVATGASITGFTRAHLLRAMYGVGIESVVYCDTDSLTVTRGANIAALPQTPNLGDWELEEANAPIGHFAGKKLYAIQLSNPGSGPGKFKLASKGARLNQKDIEKIIDGHKTQWREKDDAAGFGNIARIVNGETVTWSNDAPTFTLAGKANFVVRDIRSTAGTAKRHAPQKGSTNGK